MRTRNNEWFDIETHQIKYGIQVKTDNGWMNAFDKNGPCIFNNKQVRDQKRKQIAKQH